MRSPVRLKEYRWHAYVLAAINSRDWQNRWEVEERLMAILPPESLHRIHARYWNKQGTVHSLYCTLMGSVIRGLMRGGLAERSVPIISRQVKNVGNYSLRLTEKGMMKRDKIRRYFCQKCFNTGISIPKLDSNITCGHCRGHRLIITKL
jgi:hypothetical protein